MTLTTPPDADRTSAFLNVRVALGAFSDGTDHRGGHNTRVTQFRKDTSRRRFGTVRPRVQIPCPELTHQAPDQLLSSKSVPSARASAMLAREVTERSQTFACEVER